MEVTGEIKEDARRLTTIVPTHTASYEWSDDQRELVIDFQNLPSAFRDKDGKDMCDAIRNLIFTLDVFTDMPQDRYVVEKCRINRKIPTLAPLRVCYLKDNKLQWENVTDASQSQFPPMNRSRVERFMVSKALPNAVRIQNADPSTIDESDSLLANYQLYWTMACLGCQNISIRYNNQSTNIILKLVWRVALPIEIEERWNVLVAAAKRTRPLPPLPVQRPIPVIHSAVATAAATTVAAAAAAVPNSVLPAKSVIPGADAVKPATVVVDMVADSDNDENTVNNNNTNTNEDDEKTQSEMQTSADEIPSTPPSSTASSAVATTATVATVVPSKEPPTCSKCKKHKPLAQKASSDDDDDDESEEEEEEESGSEENDAPVPKKTEKIKYESMCSYCKKVCGVCRKSIEGKALANETTAQSVGYYLCVKCAGK